jgi:hypothetical protein
VADSSAVQQVVAAPPDSRPMASDAPARLAAAACRRKETSGKGARQKTACGLVRSHVCAQYAMMPMTVSVDHLLGEGSMCGAFALVLSLPPGRGIERS